MNHISGFGPTSSFFLSSITSKRTEVCCHCLSSGNWAGFISFGKPSMFEVVTVFLRRCAKSWEFDHSFTVRKLGEKIKWWKEVIFGKFLNIPPRYFIPSQTIEHSSSPGWYVKTDEFKFPGDNRFIHSVISSTLSIKDLYDGFFIVTSHND